MMDSLKELNSQMRIAVLELISAISKIVLVILLVLWVCRIEIVFKADTWSWKGTVHETHTVTNDERIDTLKILTPADIMLFQMFHGGYDDK